MIKSIYFYETLKQSYANFRRIKKIPTKEIIHEMAQNPDEFIKMEYVKRDNLKKTVLTLNGDSSDWAVIEDFLLECNFSEVFGQMLFNYMYKHKDDEPRTGNGNGKVLSVYLSPEEWAMLQDKKGNKTVSEYIKEVLRG